MNKDMEEFDLKNIWKSSDDQAKVYYRSIEPEVLEISRQKSNDLLHEIKRNAINETVTGVLLMFAVFYFFRNHPYVWILYSCTVLLWPGIIIAQYFFGLVLCCPVLLWTVLLRVTVNFDRHIFSQNYCCSL
jgi:hypothetical protein